MKGGLFGRLLAAMCGVAAASMALVLVLQERSLSRDLERAAELRLEAAAAGSTRLLERHLEMVAERWSAVSATPVFRATLEVNDAPTLRHYAGTLLEQYGAARVAFVRAGGQRLAAAGEEDLDGLALAVEGSDLVARDERAYVVVGVPLAEAGRLVAVEPIGPDTLELWSELCGAEVFLARVGEDAGAELDRVVRRMGSLELRVASSLRSEREAIANARLQLALAAALGLALAFVASLVSSRALVRPIQQVQAAARRLGGGDLTTTVDVQRRDEIGDVARAFAEMTRELRGTIGHVSEAADRVEATALAITEGSRRFAAVTSEQRREAEGAAGTAEEIERRVGSISASARESALRLDGAVSGSTASFRELARSGEVLAANAARMRSLAEEIVGSAGQVARSAGQVAADTEALLPGVESTAQRVEDVATAAESVKSHVDETERLSRQVAEIAENGRSLARDAVAGMDATERAISESERVMRSLRDRGEQIGAILSVIDEVADQTGLLALNATIIAAQAGEHGRSFAIVGDEMRELAERVQASTKEIDEVVRAVQSESAAAAESIGTGSRRAREGAVRIRETETSLGEIARAARESGERMTECVRATALQLESATAVRAEMETVRQGVGRIRAATREQADASDAVQRSCAALQEGALGVEDAVAQQTHGTDRIGEIVEAVQSGVREVTGGLEQQVESSRQVAEVVRSSIAHTRSHEASAAEMAEAAGDLGRQAEALRRAVRRFRTSPG